MGAGNNNRDGGLNMGEGNNDRDGGLYSGCYC